MAGMKINLTKMHAHYYNVMLRWYGVVPTKIFQHKNFVILKFHNTKISRSTVLTKERPIAAISPAAIDIAACSPSMSVELSGKELTRPV